MGTFLTNSKMAKELAARIESSVRGRRAASGLATITARGLSLLRIGFAFVVVAGVCTIAISRRTEAANAERERTALLDTVRKESASLDAADKGAVARAESWLLQFIGPYSSDFVAAELRAPGAFAAVVARPAIYVHGPIESFASPTGIAGAASASAKDAFLLCLLEPPASRVEKVLLAKVRAAYAGGALVEARTANVRRLHEAEVGLPLLTPAWAERVASAPGVPELAALKKELDRAPMEKAKKAATAGLLIVAMDEPGAAGAVAELDGERVHEIRIGVVDLVSAKILLRLRKQVDPNAWQSAARAEYASGLDACALALDVHESLKK